MNPKVIAIIGAGIIGAGALIFMGGPPPAYEAGGAFGGTSKKEDAVITGTETETVIETPMSSGDTIYNIVFPDPSFPVIPEAPITVPWWITSLDPPTSTPSYTPPRTIKEILTSVTKDPTAPGVIPSSKKAEAVKEVTSRGPSTGIDILDKIKWGR